MTATPRQLSDTIKADYDEIIEDRAEETRLISRWSLVRSISGWVTFGAILTVVGSFALAMLTGSVLGFLFFVTLFLASPVLTVPALIVWVVAAAATARLEAQRREAMFSLFGITVDRSVQPPIYTVGLLPDSWLHPKLHRTRELLSSSAAEDIDTAER